MGEGHPHQAPLATTHLLLEYNAAGFLRTDPHEVERLLARSAVAFDRDYESQRDRVLARIMESSDELIGKVLDHGEGLG